jgi:DNA-binding response OmpR family regulator
VTPTTAPHILLVDDDVDSTELLSMLLSRRGFRTSIAHSLSDARAATRAMVFQVVVIDLELPDGNGSELVQQLDRTRTRAIALTGSVGQVQESNWRDAGFHQMMVKPVDIEALVGTLQRICGPCDIVTSDNPPHSLDAETAS